MRSLTILRSIKCGHLALIIPYERENDKLLRIVQLYGIVALAKGCKAGSFLRDFSKKRRDDRMTTYEIIMVVLTGISLLIAAYDKLHKR